MVDYARDYQQWKETLLQDKPFEAYASPLLKDIQMIQMDRHHENIRPIGSSSYRDIIYPSDLDCFEYIEQKDKSSLIDFFVTNIKRIVQSIVQSKTHLFMEVKAGLDQRYHLDLDLHLPDKILSHPELWDQEELALLQKLWVNPSWIDNTATRETIKKIIRKHYIIRWNAQQIKQGYQELTGHIRYTLEDAVDNVSNINIELISIVDGYFMDESNFFYLAYKKPDGSLVSLNMPEETITDFNHYFLENLKQSMSQLIHSSIDYNPMKYLKRLYSYARFAHNYQLAENILPILNGPLGYLYQTKSMIGTIKKVLEMKDRKPIVGQVLSKNIKRLNERLLHCTIFRLEGLKPVSELLLNGTTQELLLTLNNLSNLLSWYINQQTSIKLQQIGLLPIPRCFRPEHQGGSQGSGLFDEIGRHVRGMVMALKGTRTNLKPSVRTILKEIGDQPISQIQVGRKPLNATYQFAVDQLNQVTHHQPTVPYDKLFHLYLILTVPKGTYVLEKNEDINMRRYIPSEGEERILLPIPIEPLSINQMIANTLQKIGKERFFHYNAMSTNCQRFVLDMLQSNNIPLDHQQQEFILQDVSHLLPDLGQKIVHGLTSFYNRAKTFFIGEGGSEGGWYGTIRPPQEEKIIKRDQALMRMLKARGVSDEDIVKIVEKEQKDKQHHTARQIFKLYHIPLKPIQKPMVPPKPVVTDQQLEKILVPLKQTVEEGTQIDPEMVRSVVEEMIQTEPLPLQTEMGTQTEPEPPPTIVEPIQSIQLEYEPPQPLQIEHETIEYEPPPPEEKKKIKIKLRPKEQEKQKEEEEVTDDELTEMIFTKLMEDYHNAKTLEPEDRLHYYRQVETTYMDMNRTDRNKHENEYRKVWMARNRLQKKLKS